MRWSRLLLVFAAGACHKPAAEEGEGEVVRITVTCAPVAGVTLADRVSLRGVVAPPPDRQAVVAPTTSGRVARLYVGEGDQVQRGQVLASIDDPGLAAGLGEADAQVATARANERNARAAVERAKRLFAEGIVARRDVEDAEAKAAAASAEVRSAAAKHGLAAGQKDRASVRAPIAGTVVRVLKRAGETVDGTPGTPILEIADPSTLELRATAPGGDLVRLSEGQAATVRLDAVPDLAVDGKVAAVSPSVDPATSLGTVRIALAPAKEDVHLRLGLAGQAQVKLADRSAAAVPASALRRGASGKDEVLLCAGSGEAAKAEVREVKLGVREGDQVEVREGVIPGDKVITDHVLNVDDGTPIRFEAEK